jgi:hypothetical protein
MRFLTLLLVLLLVGCAAPVAPAQQGDISTDRLPDFQKRTSCFADRLLAAETERKAK